MAFRREAFQNNAFQIFGRPPTVGKRKFWTYQTPRIFVTSKPVKSPRVPGMPRGNDFSPVDPSETVTNAWDFGPWLGAAITVSLPQTSCSLLSGVDPSPSSRLIGTPQVAPSPTTNIAGQGVVQQIQGMVGGCEYILLCSVNTSDNQVLTLFAHQRCVTPD